MIKRIGLLLFFLLTGTALVAQNLDQDKLREAKVFFNHQHYTEALSILSSSRQLSRYDKEARFLIAVCQFQTNKLDAAYQSLKSLTESDKSPYPECWLYLAKVFHAQHRFKEASDHYKIYLRSIFPNDPNRRMVIEEIRRCANGIALQYLSADVVAENLGPQVNSEGDEFAPVTSPSYADRIYFSAIRSQNTGGRRDERGNPDPQWGNYFSDLFSTRVIKGMWGMATPMHYLLNSPKHEVLLGLSRDGQSMYYFKGWDLNRGEILVDTFQEAENRTLNSIPLAGPLRPDLGDNYPFFYGDTLLIFSSNRRGGYGGWDLYKCSKKNGRWLLPVNLGPTINTAFDETTPFLANDGQTLYFSSNDSHKSIGGLDVFKTVFVPQKNLWLTPKNVGLPINSAADDAFFKISRDGFTAYFASSRKDGYGKRDIYVAYFQDFLLEMEFPSTFVASRPSSDIYIPPARQTNSSGLEDHISRPKSNEPSDFSPDRSSAYDPSSGNDSDFTPITSGPDFSEEGVPPKRDKTVEHAYSPIQLEGDQPAATQYAALDRLSEELIRQPELQVVITAFNEKKGPTGLALFAAIKKAEVVAQYLQSRGVADQQIFMRGSVLSDEALRTDQVELAFSTSNGQPPGAAFPVMGIGHPGLSSQLTINQPLHYKIQVASAQKGIQEPYLEGFPYPMIEKTPDFAYYRYTLGAFSSKTEAERFRQRMKSNGRSSAFLATYRLGWRTRR